MNGWELIGKVGQGVVRSIQLIGEGTNAAADAVNKGSVAVRDSMAVTEITSVFNTTDKIVKVLNRETARDAKEVLSLNATSLKTEQTAGAWIPWYDPPLYEGFTNRHLQILIDDVPVIYIWQKGDYVYWTNRLDSEGRPAKAYKMAGVSHVGGQRTLVIRNDPDAGYSAFLVNFNPAS